MYDNIKPQGLYDPQYEHDSCGVGFVCDIKGNRSNDIVKKGLEVLKRLAHRGAVGADPDTGDGAGILLQIPHEFLISECKKSKISLPEPGSYGTGLIFLPTNASERKSCKDIFKKVITKEGQSLIGWRKVPVDNKVIGKGARLSEPVIEQVFISKGKMIKTQLEFERKLYVIRKQIEKAVQASKINQKSFIPWDGLPSHYL